MKRKTNIILSLFAICAILFSFRPIGGEPWVVPDKYVKMKNPITSDTKSIATGKKLYIKNCQDCHGKKGIGDGTKVPDLKTQPKDLTLASIQSQTDGAFFYKISEGKGEMPKFKKELTDPDDIWSIINFVRTLKK